MTDRELIEDVREQAEGFSGKSGCVYTSEWYTRVANRLEDLLAENERLKAECDRWRETATKLWAGVPRYCGDLPRFETHADEPPSTEEVE